MLPKRVGMPNMKASYRAKSSTFARGYPGLGGALMSVRISGPSVSATLKFSKWSTDTIREL